ncbi:MAG: zf-HC2 domain-containing protein [Armatimonadetes bacterium]|nr:zf-HC2 domain-containing protein [Armatimonadota bacterium]MDW8026943.1 zf-HC2 domain-containing protein [Armatimonadota bacterium]
MTCREVTELMVQFWSGELDEETERAMEAHLQSCLSCREEWAITNAAMLALKNAPTPEPTPELLNRIKLAVIAKQVPKPAPVWRWAFAFGATAVVFLLLFTSAHIFRKRSISTFAELNLPSQPALRPNQPSPPAISMAPAIKVPTSPRERLAKKPPSTTTQRLETLTTKESGKRRSAPPILTEEPPALEIPHGESLDERKSKDTSSDIDIFAQPELLSPKIAELPSEPRKVPFRAELELKEGLKIPMPETEMTQTPKSPPSPTATTPMMARQKEAERSQGLGLVQDATQMPLITQHGGGLQQTIAAMPFQIRWVRFEPILVGRVSLWQLGLTSESQQIVRVWIQPGEKVEVLNAQQQLPFEAKGLLIWQDKLIAAKEALIPVLIRANEVGSRKLLVIVETAGGKTFPWWLIFPAVLREDALKFRRPITFQIEHWKVLNLLSHLAWESKISFLLPDSVAQSFVNVPAKAIPFQEILELLERQMRGRFVRFGNTLSWFSDAPSAVTPMKQ